MRDLLTLSDAGLRCGGTEVQGPDRRTLKTRRGSKLCKTDGQNRGEPHVLSCLRLKLLPPAANCDCLSSQGCITMFESNLATKMQTFVVVYLRPAVVGHVRGVRRRRVHRPRAAPGRHAQLVLLLCVGRVAGRGAQRAADCADCLVEAARLEVRWPPADQSVLCSAWDCPVESYKVPSVVAARMVMHSSMFCSAEPLALLIQRPNQVTMQCVRVSEVGSSRAIPQSCCRGQMTACRRLTSPS